MKKFILILLTAFSIGCSARSAEIATNVEKNIHTYLNAFRTEFRARCENNVALANPCETVRKAWTELLEVAIQYDETLISGKINQATVVSFKNEIADFIKVVQSTELKDLTPNLTAVQGVIK